MSDAPPLPDAHLWRIRAWVYATLVTSGRPPTVAACAAHWSLPPQTARAAFRARDARHALLLLPDGESIHMAHPFSGVPTPVVVRANGVRYWANCAWDALGFPAALHADATIAAATADDAPVHLAVCDGALQGLSALVHFALPFRRWYDDLVGT